MNKLIFYHTDKDIRVKEIGGKAQGLYNLVELGMNVPSFAVIPISSLGKIDQAIDAFLAELDSGKNIQSFAVRSSAVSEDGSERSYAGIFESKLNVKESELKDVVREILGSTDRAITYKKQLVSLDKNTDEVAIIIQEMVESDQSGVAFSVDPVSYEHKHVINACSGLGDKLVSGEVEGEHYAVKSEMINYEKNVNDSPILSTDQILEVSKTLAQLSESLGFPVDIEFAFSNHTLYLLQARPITAIPKGTYTVYDNSNIVESYPGITTPLTFSFILMVYTRVYKQFTQLMGVRKSEVINNEHVFQNTLGLVKGRVYYNLLNWYKMLAMAPGFSINARYMETMMGVKERFDLKDQFQLNKTMAKLRVVFMLLNIIRIQIGIKRRTRHFIDRLNKVLRETRKKNLDKLSFQDLKRDFKHFEEQLILQWKAPLINDFFSMIWFGLLKKLCEKHFPDHSNMHNDLLCGSNDIISTQPMEESLRITAKIQEDAEWKFKFKNNDEASILEYIKSNPNDSISISIHQFIERFGDRCIGELKLESVSYRNDPKLFIRLLKSYVKENLDDSVFGNFSNQKIREKAELIVKEYFSSISLKKLIFNRVLKKTRYLVSNRENLRYERTRVFGFVREYFIQMGKRLKEMNVLDDHRDIFYLEHDEILTIHSEIDVSALKAKVNKRKKQFAEYKNDPPPNDRFFTYDNDFSNAFIYAKNTFDDFDGVLKGIGCSPGEINGEVMVIDNPEQTDSVEGKIMVARSTDPGWVKLFPSASAIVVEKGSLLSHTSIVAREMGIPCIVGVDHLLETLKTNDRIAMNGRTGEIIILNEHE